MKKYFKLMRVKHYLKNALVAVPVFFGKEIFSGKKAMEIFLGILAFCLISSTVYIVNDIKDVEKDRLHPTKRLRPIASGEVTCKKAILLGICCFAGACTLHLFLENKSCLFLLLLYLVLNIAYSMGLKNIPLLDVVILVSGFLIRILYGSVLSGVEISGWLYLTVISGAFYLGLGKRRNEMVKNKNQGTRTVLSYYTREFLDKNMYMCMGLANTFYALWTMESEKKVLLWTAPLVMLITMRYSLDVEGNYDGDPMEVILKDHVLLGMGVVYAVFLVWFLYFSG